MMRACAILLLTGLCLGWACGARAQLQDADTLRWSLRAGLNSSLVAGNVERYLGVGSLEAAHVRRQVGLSAGAQYQYGTFGKRLTEDDLTTRLFVYGAPKARVYPYLMTLYEFNLRRRIGRRAQVGPGATWVVVRKPGHSLKLSLTGTYERTDFDAPLAERATPRPTVEIWRATLRAAGRHALQSGKLRAWYELWFQQGLTDADNYRGHAAGGLEANLGAGFRLTSTAIYTYEHVVPTGVKRYDLLWLVGAALYLHTQS